MTGASKDSQNTSQLRGFTEETKQDGTKLRVCEHCRKEFKTEQGVKAHIDSKHRESQNKRKKSRDDEEDEENADEIKKARLSLLFSEHDVSDFEFDQDGNFVSDRLSRQIPTN